MFITLTTIGKIWYDMSHCTGEDDFRVNQIHLSVVEGILLPSQKQDFYYLQVVGWES